MVSMLIDRFTSPLQITVTSIEAQNEIENVLLIDFKKIMMKHYNSNFL